MMMRVVSAISIFYRYDNDLAYSYGHACLVRSYAHDWLYTHFQTCDRDFLDGNGWFGYSYYSFCISSFFQVAISYELHLFHEPIHMKEKNDM